MKEATEKQKKSGKEYLLKLKFHKLPQKIISINKINCLVLNILSTYVIFLSIVIVRSR